MSKLLLKSFPTYICIPQIINVTFSYSDYSGYRIYLNEHRVPCFSILQLFCKISGLYSKGSSRPYSFKIEYRTDKIPNKRILMNTPTGELIMKDIKIYQETTQLMWSIMPTRAMYYEFYGKIYNNYLEHLSIFYDKEYNKFYFDFGKTPKQVTINILNLMSKLRTLPLFKKEPWTHFKITLHDDGKSDFEFAYIPEDKDEPGVYMKEGNRAPYPPES